MSAAEFAAAIRRAFLWHWHLLAFGTGAGFALLSGQPEIWVPLLGSLEMAYLGFLGLHPRFQNVLRGRERTQRPGGDQRDAALERFQRFATFLTEDDAARFDRLRTRCATLLDLRRSMDQETENDGVDKFRGESLDRMLWLCLKLLHQRSGLWRFLEATNREEIERELRDAEKQLQASNERDTTAALESRLTASIRERIKTIQDRLANHDKACENLELVGAEIDKTEQQITHICEVGMTTRDSANLATQIDSISESLQSSEKAFAHASVGGLLDDETTPPLLTGNLAPPSSFPDAQTAFRPTITE